MATSSPPRYQDSDYTSQNLNRLLHRLQQNLLTPADSDRRIRRLKHSQCERKKASANVEYARTLLLRLEHSTTSATAPAQRSRTSTATGPPSNPRAPPPASLQEKRALLRRIQKRLDDLNHPIRDRNGGSESESSASADSDNEELLNRFAPIATDTDGGGKEAEARKRERERQQSKNTNQLYRDAETVESEAASATTGKSAAPAQTMQQGTLRSRNRGKDAPSNDTGKATPRTADRGSTTSSSTLPANASSSERLGTIHPFSPAPTAPNLTSAQLLEAHDTEQTSLTDSLLQLASALKESTQQFAAELEGSNPLVDVAAAALDRNVSGMEKASGRIAQLRRMTEGVGWFARLGLYGKVGVLWVVLVLVMGVMPKLRF